MVSTSSQPINYNWKDVIRQCTKLYKGICNGETDLIPALEVQLYTNKVHHKTTFLQEISRLEPQAYANAKDAAEELEQAVLKGAEGVKASGKTCEGELQEYANKGDHKDTQSAKDRIHEITAGHRKTADKAIDAVEQKALEKIDQVGRRQHESLVNMYDNSTSALVVFIGSIAKWLGGAYDQVVNFLTQIWEKVKEFAVNVKNWFVNAWNTIKGVFGVMLVAASRHSNYSIGCVDGIESFLLPDSWSGLDWIASRWCGRATPGF